MTSPVFRIFNPGGPKEDRVQKRRAQLRQAQQTYRERKDKYTKSLEREVARSRANEVRLLNKVEQLQSAIQQLVGSLQQQGLGVSLEGMSEPFEKDMLLYENSPTSHSPLERHSNVQARRNDAITQAAQSSYLTGSREKAVVTSQSTFAGSTLIIRDSPERDLFSSDTQDGYSANSSPNMELSDVEGALPHRNVRICDTNPVEAGMDFVLTLEKPCLDHIHGNPDNPDEPSGHALTTSAQLLSVSTLPSVHSHNLPGELQKGVPAALLDSLLNLSSQLCSDHEMTPVQAWNYIRHQPQFGGLEVRTLHVLAETLRNTVKCHGFGAVVDKKAFEKLVLDTLLVGRPF